MNCGNKSASPIDGLTQNVFVFSRKFRISHKYFRKSFEFCEKNIAKFRFTYFREKMQTFFRETFFCPSTSIFDTITLKYFEF